MAKNQFDSPPLVDQKEEFREYMLQLFSDVYGLGSETNGSLAVDENVLNSFTTDIVPSIDDTYDLGSATYQWQDLFLSGSLYFDGINQFTHDGTNFTFNDSISVTGDGIFSGNITAVDGTFSGDLNLPSFTDGSVLFIDSGAIAEDAAHLFYDTTYDILTVGHVTSERRIFLEGANVISRLRLSELEDSNAALLQLHRHSIDSAVGNAIIGSRSNSAGTGHGTVTGGMALLELSGAGWGDTTRGYEKASQILFEVDGTGAVAGDDDMPGRIRFLTRPDGASEVLTEAMRINSAGTATVTNTWTWTGGGIVLQDGLSLQIGTGGNDIGTITLNTGTPNVLDLVLGSDADFSISTATTTDLFYIDESADAVSIGDSTPTSTTMVSIRTDQAVYGNNKTVGLSSSIQTKQTNASTFALKFENNLASTGAMNSTIYGAQGFVQYLDPEANVSGTLIGGFFQIATRAATFANTHSKAIGIQSAFLPALTLQATTISDYRGLDITHITSTAQLGAVLTFTTSYGVYISNGIHDANTAIGTQYGIYLEKQNKGSTKHGIALAGDGVGSDIVFGAAQDVNIYFDNSDLIINSNNVTASDEVHFTNFDVYKFDNTLEIVEKSADPSDPAEGLARFWMSDGSATGDDGDLLYMEQSGAVVETGSLKWKDFVASSSTLTTGDDIAGDYTDTQVMFDGNSWNVSETSGAPPNLDCRLNFTNIDRYPQFVIARWEYDGGSGHIITIDIWNYNTTAWDTLRSFSDDSGFGGSMTQYIPIGIGDDYVDGSGNAIVRFYHQSNGIDNHDLFIDYVGLTHSLQGVI